jgi:hypothetical protein
MNIVGVKVSVSEEKNIVRVNYLTYFVHSLFYDTQFRYSKE